MNILQNESYRFLGKIENDLKSIENKIDVKLKKFSVSMNNFDQHKVIDLITEITQIKLNVNDLKMNLRGTIQEEEEYEEVNSSEEDENETLDSNQNDPMYGKDLYDMGLYDPVFDLKKPLSPAAFYKNIKCKNILCLKFNYTICTFITLIGMKLAEKFGCKIFIEEMFSVDVVLLFI